MIAHNEIRYPKTLKAVKADGAKPLYFHALSDKQEAQWIYGKIQELHQGGVKYGDVAILYRAHYLTRPLEECFIRNELSYKIFSGVEFYGRKEIKDLVCYLRMVTAGDNIAFLRTINTPSRKFGKKKLDVLRDYAESRHLSLYQALRDTFDQEPFRGSQAGQYVNAIESVKDRRRSLSLPNLLQSLMDLSGYEAFIRLQGDQERLDNVAEFKRGVERAAEDEDMTLEDFLASVALFTNLDREGERDSVKLMTIHTAKGMEFPVVFLCGLDEGIFPSRKTDTPEDMEEERRLAYVAMTRAKDNLFLSDCEGVTSDNLFKYPSRFLFEAGKENIDYVAPLDASLEERARKFIAAEEKRLKGQVDHFAAGDRVTHPVFGIGTIVDVNSADSSYTIQFDSLKTLRTLLFSANLQKG